MSAQPHPAPPTDTLAVALYARLYRLLADRPEFLAADIGTRIDAAWTSDAPGSLPVLDRVMVARADDTDRLCGYAVAKLRTQASGPLLDVLGMLGPERIVAMYYALPAQRRATAMRDGTWAYHVARIDHDAVMDAFSFWDELPDLRPSTDLSAAAQASTHRFVREAERYRRSLPSDLSPAERALIDNHE